MISCPADCTIVDGDVEVDQAAITGESAPVARTAGGYWSRFLLTQGVQSRTRLLQP
ncbi:MAG: hypothetical protein ACRD6W_14370 [Nitrososphaerales archaeon]